MHHDVPNKPDQLLEHVKAFLKEHYTDEQQNEAKKDILFMMTELVEEYNLHPFLDAIKLLARNTNNEKD